MIDTVLAHGIGTRTDLPISRALALYGTGFAGRQSRRHRLVRVSAVAVGHVLGVLLGWSSR